MPRGSDYERAESEIDEFADEIEFQEGEAYDDLTDYQQRNVILDIFFKGDERKISSAEKLRQGINAVRGTTRTTEQSTYFDEIKRGGKTYTVVRDQTTGRIKQWVRE